MKIIVFLFFVFANSFITEYLFPFYNFSMHNHPIVWTNKTHIKEEMGYYREMRKLSLFHTVGSAVGGLFAFTFITPAVATLPVVYCVYYGFMNWHSAHLEQACEDHLFYVDYKYEKPWNERIVIPEIVFNPVVFLLLIYIFSFFIFYRCYGNTKSITQKSRTFLYWFCMILLFLYTYSFFQKWRESRHLVNAERDYIRNEIKSRCRKGGLGFWSWVKKEIWSVFGIQTDQDGYNLTPECKKLHLDLEKSGESIIEIFFKTIIGPKKTILKEIWYSINWLDKIFFITLATLIFFIKYLFKNKNGYCIQKGGWKNKDTKYKL